MDYMIPEIEDAEPDAMDYMIPEIEDAEPEAASWGLTRVGTSSRGRTGSGVNIYVQDTGIRYSHQDFGGRAVPAIDLTTANGARPAVLSMSLGGRGADPSYTASIGAATDAGVVVVVAAGNSNSDACNFSPAFAAAAITVGSTTISDARSSFSNYGRCVQIR